MELALSWARLSSTNTLGSIRRFCRSCICVVGPLLSAQFDRDEIHSLLIVYFNYLVISTIIELRNLVILVLPFIFEESIDRCQLSIAIIDAVEKKFSLLELSREKRLENTQLELIDEILDRWMIANRCRARKSIRTEYLQRQGRLKVHLKLRVTKQPSIREHQQSRLYKSSI